MAQTLARKTRAKLSVNFGKAHFLKLIASPTKHTVRANFLLERIPAAGISLWTVTC